jgi:hypothetical protein
MSQHITDELGLHESTIDNTPVSEKRLDTVAAIRIEKQAMERKIAQLVVAFENYTHLKVEAIQILRTEVTTRVKMKRIEVEARASVRI